MQQVKRFVWVTMLSMSALALHAANPDSARQLIERQARAFEKQDFTFAAADWLPTAVMMSPEARTPAPEIPASMKDYFSHFTDLKVTLKNLIVSPDGNKLALEWDWETTRKKDGKRGVTHDAIIVDLKDGKIASWREYYDPAASGQATP